MILKSVNEHSPEDIKEVHKEKKTMNILFNGLDQDMFDNVILHYLKRGLGHHLNIIRRDRAS